MADPNYSEIKSTLLKAISDHLDSLDKPGSAAVRAATDLYSKNTPGDTYSKNTQRALGDAVVLPADLLSKLRT